MMINYLQTQSFRKLADFEAKFQPGSNILTGPNGAGKSTVFRAIRFALYGAGAAGCKKELLPSHGTKNCKVILGIDDLLITRDLRNCTIAKAGKIVAEGNTPCTQYVEDYLGMDFKAFNIFCLSAQGETQALLTVGATELNRRVEQYSGIDIIDQIIKATSADISLYKGKLEGKALVDTEPMHIALADLESTINGGRKLLHELVDGKEELEGKINRLRMKIAQHKKLNGDIQKAKELHHQAEEERNQCEIDLKEAEQQLAELLDNCAPEDGLSDKISELSSDIEIKINANSERDLEAQKLSNAVEAVERLTPLAEKEAAAKNRIELVQNDLDDIGKMLAHKRETVRAIVREIKQDKQLLNDGICPTCERPHDNFDAELVHIRCEENRVKLRHAKLLIAEDEALFDDLKKIELKEMKNVSNYDIQLTDAKMRRDATAARLESMPCYDPARIRDQQKQRDEMVYQKRSIAEHQQHIDQTKTTVERLQRAFSRNSQKMLDNAELAGYDITPTGEMTHELTEMVELLKEISKRELSQGGLVVGLESDLAHISDELTMVEANNEKFVEDNHMFGLLTSLNKLLRKRRGEFMAKIWSGILSRASHFVNEVTAGWITEIGRDDTGNFTFRERGGIPCPIIGTASGAQAAFCGAAIRIGISLSVHGSNALMMLDEPTESMSEENAAKLAAGLLSLGGQTMLITHRKTEAVSAQSVIEL